MSEEVWRAVEAGEVERVQAYLQSGGGTEVRSPSGLTPLMIAAGRGDTGMVKALLTHGASVFAVDSQAGASPLHRACQGGSLEVVQMLVEEGKAFIDLPTATTGHTPLVDALWYKWPQIVGYLVKRGAGLNLSTHYGFSLKQHIAYERSVNFFDRERFAEAERMVQAQITANELSVKNQQLMSAVNCDNLSEVRRLLSAGADVNERFPVVNGFNDRHTPLHVACRDGHTEIAAVLVENRADVNAVEPAFGAVPLHKAVYNGHVAITALLVQQPGIDLNFQGFTNGYTPLHDALWHGYADCALILIAAGAKLDLRGHDGLLPRDLAKSVFDKANEVTKRLFVT